MIQPLCLQCWGVRYAPRCGSCRQPILPPSNTERIECVQLNSNQPQSNVFHHFHCFKQKWTFLTPPPKHHYSESTSYKNNEPYQCNKKLTTKAKPREDTEQNNWADKKYNELVLQTTFAFTSTIYLLCLFKKLINESWKRVFFNFILLWHDFRIQCWIINVLITHVTYVMENVASENV